MNLKVYEFTLHDWTGGDDKRDHEVVWIAAVDMAHAQAALPNHMCWGEAEGVSPDDPAVNIAPARVLP